MRSEVMLDELMNYILLDLLC